MLRERLGMFDMGVSDEMFLRGEGGNVTDAGGVLPWGNLGGENAVISMTGTAANVCDKLGAIDLNLLIQISKDQLDVQLSPSWGGKGGASVLGRCNGTDQGA
jgi:hypothetical protein